MDNKPSDADFFKELDKLIQKHRHKGFIHIFGLLEFAKAGLTYEASKNMKDLEK